ncbi:hypothetical protein M0802_001399 [Mischocyttarus mexicanus]|nr:hypothetical protein M0802_001399 [Mischocyttarus mexicanus]
MAITAVTSCLGPPPLPPGKRFLQKSSKKLSSTYRSFRDPAMESWLPNGIIIEKAETKLYPCESVTPTVGTYVPSGKLFRSRSEGNLGARKTGTNLFASTPLDKCIKAIYGSWRNLMHHLRQNVDFRYLTSIKKKKGIKYKTNGGSGGDGLNCHFQLSSFNPIKRGRNVGREVRSKEEEEEEEVKVEVEDSSSRDTRGKVFKFSEQAQWFLGVSPKSSVLSFSSFYHSGLLVHYSAT